MSTIDELATPALIVDLDRLERNITGMAERAAGLGVSLRPHVKTHKCVEIGRLQIAAGARGITVATLYEAEVFATAGFDDLTWAFPVIPSRGDQISELAERVRLGVVVDHPQAVDVVAGLERPVRVWVKVDCGYHRCGVPVEGDAILRLAERIVAAGIELAGLLSHSGDAYAVHGDEARAAVAESERAGIVGAARRLRDAGIDVPGISVGSTPAMTAARSLEGVTEARPGNYAYFDRTQVALGSCTIQDCALTVLSTVVSSSPDHAVLDVGALAMSKDRGPAKHSGDYGVLFSSYAEGRVRDDVRLVSLSQEHGKLDGPLAWGERVRILPNHSCLTAACFTHVYAVRGERVLDRWRVWNGR